jgi:hypothetical protein
MLDLSLYLTSIILIRSTLKASAIGVCNAGFVLDDRE